MHLTINSCWLNFGAYHLRSFDVVRNFWFLQLNDIGQNCVHLYLIRIILSQSLSNSKHLFILTIVRLYTIFVYVWKIVKLFMTQVKFRVSFWVINFNPSLSAHLLYKSIHTCSFEFNFISHYLKSNFKQIERINFYFHYPTTVR